MELIFEALLELVLEGSLDASTNKKVPLIIRIPLALVVIAFILLVTLGLVAVGAFILPENLPAGILFATVGIVLLILGSGKILEVYRSFSKK